MAGKKMQVPLLVVIIALLSIMDQEVAADVCADNMIYMDLCTQWKEMCSTSKFLQEKCPNTCEVCKPEPCVWDEFSEYTECSQPCAGGFKTRSRVVLTPPLYGGEPCEGSAFESTVCNDSPCPEDCEWDLYGDWSECDKPCGGGTEFRERVVKSEAKYGGENCTGEEREEKQCNVHNCAVHCEYEPWSDFSTCSKECDEGTGGGTQQRHRGVKVAAAHGGDECNGDSNEEQACNTHKCPIHCEWDEWSEWDKCSRTCGGGMTARIRNIKQYAKFGGTPCEGEAGEMNPCHEEKCPKDCKWGPFAAATDCSQTCGDGLKSRTREYAEIGDPEGRNCTGPATVELNCNLRPCGTPCIWNEFGPWGTCSKTCGDGEQERTRTIKQKAAFGGTPCEPGPSETRPCNVKECPVPVDCEWDEFGDWTKCTKTCGNGNQIRTRVVLTTAKNGGIDCDGTNTDFRPCNEFACPENCEWNDFGAWSDCDKDCGGGTQSRTRTVFKEAKSGGKPCPGAPTEEQACNEAPCSINCLWDEFGEWSKCTESCGGGTETRVRTIKQKAAYGGMTCSGYATESRNCNEEPCKWDCQWGPFAEWNPCSKSCGGGEQTRTKVIAQAARNGGEPCNKEEGTERRECNAQLCPVPCAWSAFSKWTPCSQNCGGGYQMRTRTVVVEAAEGGKACHGCATDSRACNLQSCARNCKWNPWTPWSPCSEVCNGGTQNRTREVRNLAANGGQECEGESTNFRDCNTQKCPIPCEWTPWGEWDTCTKTCGGGMQGRVRSVLQKERYGGKPCEGDPQQMQGCSMQACPICKDSPRYARFCPAWVAYCGNSDFVKGCCAKSCRLC